MMKSNKLLSTASFHVYFTIILSVKQFFFCIHKRLRGSEIAAVGYLERHLPSLTNPYAVAMVSYALANENKLNKEILYRFASEGFPASCPKRHRNISVAISHIHNCLVPFAFLRLYPLASGQSWTLYTGGNSLCSFSSGQGQGEHCPSRTLKLYSNWPTFSDTSNVLKIVIHIINLLRLG